MLSFAVSLTHNKLEGCIELLSSRELGKVQTRFLFITFDLAHEVGIPFKLYIVDVKQINFRMKL